MNAFANNIDVFKALNCARLVAQLAEDRGIAGLEFVYREPLPHVGAVVADAVLQAGLNYRTVVKVRIDRILQDFPEAETLSGTITTIARIGAPRFLDWRHHVKLQRFEGLINLLGDERVDNFDQLQSWLRTRGCVEQLMAIHGVGPKTVDYLRSLAGLDFVAVDRHIKAFAHDAGVASTDYEFLQTVVSYAADLLGVSRRNLDTSIWTYVAERKSARHSPKTFPRPFDGLGARSA